MTERLNYWNAAPEALKPMLALEGHFAKGLLEHSLRELVKIRASQINGCAYCLHMHTSDALAAGERLERIVLLSAWRESAMYSPRERAALAWTEALTRVAETGAPDADYQGLTPHFSAQEIVELSLLVTTINAWNRLAVGFRSQHPNDASLQAAA